MAGELTKEQLNSLMGGISKIKLIPQTGTVAATMFDTANEIYTIRDSVNIKQAEPSKTEIKIDQADTAIAAFYEPGDFTITGQIPSVAKEILDYFFETNSTATAAITGHGAGTGLEVSSKKVKATMLIESGDKQMAVAFMNVEFVARFSWSNTSSSLLNISFTATVLSNPDGDDMVVFPAAAGE